MLNNRYFAASRIIAGLLCSTAFAIAALPACAAAADQETQQAPARQGEIPMADGAIIVTANKRAQTLLEVSSAVQTLGGDALREDGVKNFIDLAQQTPGVIVSTPLVGGSTIQNFTIRGIGFDDFRPNGNPSAAVHFDGVYQGSSALIGGQMFDVARVEVLKGPQGTLYGRNTTAGAVNVISNKPSDIVEGQAFADYSSFNTWRAEAAVNVPLTPTVALRVSGLYDSTDGYLTSLGNPIGAGFTSVPGVIPPTIDPGVDENAARSEFWGGRALLSVGMGTGTELLLNVHGFTDRGGQAQSEPADGSTPPRSYYTNVDARRARDSWGASLTLNQDIVDDVLLSIVGAYDTLDSDYDWNDGTVRRTWDIDYIDTIKQGQVEARLQNRVPGDFNWTVGGAWFRDSVELYSTLDGSDTFRTIFEADYKQDRESFAGFANVDFAVAPRLRVDAGIRLTNEKSTFRGTTLDLDPYGLTTAGPVFDLPAIFNNTLDETSPSGRIALNYEVNDATRIYASVGRGFRAGGFDGTTIWSAPEALPFDSETVWAYEGGMKFLPRGGLLQAELAAFYYDFSNIQANSSIVYDGASTSVRTNVGKARSMGAEATLSAKPAPGLDIGLAVAMLDTKILEISTGSAAEQAARLGRDLPFAPNLTFNGTVRYEIPVSASLTIVPQVDVRYVSGYYGNLDNSSEVGNFPLVNARVDFRIDDSWTLAGYVRNLTDEVYSTGGSAATRLSGAPRVWGVSAGVRF